MDRGIDFLKSQINNAVMQHQTFVENLVDHEKQADDARFRALCARFIPKAQSHQRMLEDRCGPRDVERGFLLEAAPRFVLLDLVLQTARHTKIIRVATPIVKHAAPPAVEFGPG